MKLETALEGMMFEAYHGWYPEEAKVAGKFQVDIVLEHFVYDDKSFHNLEDVINYEEVFALVKKQMAEPRKLLEELGKSIISEISEKYPYLQKVKLKITKFNPQKKFDGANASISMERQL